MPHIVSFDVPLKADDSADSESKKDLSVLPDSKYKRLPPLPPSSPRSLILLPPERALSRSATVPSAQPAATTKSRTLSSSHHAVYSINLMPPHNQSEKEKSATPSPPKAVASTPTRRIVRRKLGADVTQQQQQQEQSQPPEPDPVVQPPELGKKPTNPLGPSATGTGTGTGDSEDDESTLVSCSDAHVCKAGHNAEGVLFKDNGPNQPIAIMHRKILEHVPGFSDDENDDDDDTIKRVVGAGSSRKRTSRERIPTPPSRCWGLRSTTQVEFEVVEEARAIPANTALRPPPWHHHDQGGDERVGGVYRRRSRR